MIDIRYFDSVTSTSDVIKDMAKMGAPEGTVVIADHQSAGRGRMGRSFMSPRGTGLYMSILLRPKLPASDALLITTAAAAAVAGAIEKHTGKPTAIKWVNDIYSDGKKVCGILTEGQALSDGSLDFAVLGIGVNLTLPEGGFGGLKDIAGAIFDSAGFDKDALASDILNNFFGYYKVLESKPHYGDYCARDMLSGKTVTVYRAGEALYDAVVKGIGDDFSLITEHCGITEKLSTGEVSVRVK